MTKSDLEEEVKIFETYLMILEDTYLVDETIQESINTGIAIEFVFSERIKSFIRTMNDFDDYYFKERKADFQNIAIKILNEYLGREVVDLLQLNEECIIVAKDIPAFEVFKLQNKYIKGLVTEVGGRTSHAAIMARAFEIPTVFGIEDATSELQNGTEIIIDGAHGIVIVEPDEDEKHKYQNLLSNYKNLEKKLKEMKGMKPITIDGHNIELSANISLPQEIKEVIENDSKGIGLFRTEFLFLKRNDFPTEEEQFQIYKPALASLAPYPIIIRTIDLGGDKLIMSNEFEIEKNPFLGTRAIRLSLAHIHYFKQQLRAILRASAFGNVKIMYPMITTVEEIFEVKEIFDTVCKELEKENIKFNKNIEKGIMIETPSAALESDYLGKFVDFFSIGTNDLTQYTLAVDRTNRNVAYLFKQFHPSVIKLMQQTVKAAHKNKIWCGICGELAGEPLATILLVGMGFDELSTSAFILPEIKSIINSISYEEAKLLAEKVLKLNKTQDVKDFLYKVNKEKFPDYFE